MKTAAESICEKFNFSQRQFVEFCALAPHKYKKFYIPKKNSNERRLVAQPSRTLKDIQRWLMSEYFCLLPVHDAASAYRTGVGIRSNAESHLGKSFLLKYDFKDFFPSIKSNDFLRLMAKEQIGISQYESELLSRLVFWSPAIRPGLELCIGAPSSPVISNALMYDFDELINQECLMYDLVYTRYADDISISGNSAEDLRGIARKLEDIVFHMESPKLLLNAKKTRFIGKNTDKKITGVFITNDGRLTVGRKVKRKVRALIHNYKNDELSKKDKERLKGYLCYIHDIEPDFVERFAEDFFTWDI